MLKANETPWHPIGKESRLPDRRASARPDNGSRNATSSLDWAVITRREVRRDVLKPILESAPANHEPGSGFLARGHACSRAERIADQDEIKTLYRAHEGGADGIPQRKEICLIWRL